jgi:hypothetical protein
MNGEMTMPKPIEAYIHAINAHDSHTFLSSFTNDAVVNDVGRESARHGCD